MRQDIMLSFPLWEYERRIAQLIGLMQKNGFDAVIFTSDDNTFYFTGFRSIVWDSKVSTPAVVVITADGDISLTTTSGGRETARVTSCVEDIRYMGPGGYETLAKGIVSLLEEKKLLSGRIGFELGTGHKMHLNYTNTQQLFAELGQAEIADAAAMLWQIRGIKSPLEIERVRKSGEICSKSIENGFRKVRLGTTEDELYRMIASDAYLMGAERMLLLGVRAGKERYSQGNCPPSERPIGKGEMILVDGGPCYKGYFTDIIRQAMIGKPTERQQAIFDVAREATYAGIEAIKPGNPFCAVHQAVDAFIKKSPFASLYPYRKWVGHSLGLSVHEYPMLDDSTELIQPGMVFAIEPEIFEKDLGSMGVEENLVVTETGCEIITPTDSHLMLLPE